MKPAHAVDVLTPIDQKIAAIEEQLKGLRAARQLVIEACGVSVVGQTAPDSTTQLVTTMPARRSARVTSSRRAKAMPRTERAAVAGVDERVLAFIQKQVAPISVGAIEKALKITRYILRGSLERLEKAGEIKSAGQTSSRRVGTPAVMANATEED